MMDSVNMSSLRDFYKQVAWAVSAAFLVLFLHSLGALNWLESGLSAILSPILSRGFALSSYIGDNYLLFKDKRDLIDENAELKSRLTEKMKAQSQCFSVEEENSFLRKQLEYRPPQTYDFKIARVVGKNYDNNQNALIIEMGEVDGVVVGAPVLSADGVLIGKIFKTNRSNAFVLLLNDQMSKVAVRITNADNSLGLLEGKYGLGLTVDYLPQTENLAVGDLVLTSELETTVPPGLLIGEVAKIISEPENLFKQAIVRSPVDFNKIDYVKILIKQSEHVN